MRSLFLQKNIASKTAINRGINYVLGKINHKEIVFVNSGLGKINAAAIATRLIRDFQPKLILMSGPLVILVRW